MDMATARILDGTRAAQTALDTGHGHARVALRSIGELTYAMGRYGRERHTERLLQARADLWASLRGRPEVIAAAAAARAELVANSGGLEPTPPDAHSASLEEYARWGFLNGNAQLGRPGRWAMLAANRWVVAHRLGAHDARQSRAAVQRLVPSWAERLEAEGRHLTNGTGPRLLHVSAGGARGVPPIWGEDIGRKIALNQLLISAFEPSAEFNRAVVLAHAGTTAITAPSPWAMFVLGPTAGLRIRDGGALSGQAPLEHSTALRLFDRGAAGISYETALDVARGILTPAETT